MNELKTKLSVYFEVFDTDNDNEYITCYPTAEEAIEYAEEENASGKHYAVDMVIDLEDSNGESLTSSGDYLYTMQIYPKIKQYDNHDEEPVLVLNPSDIDERPSSKLITADKDAPYDILHDTVRDIYYVWDKAEDKALQDDAGDVIYFHTYDGVCEFLENEYNYKVQQ